MAVVQSIRQTFTNNMPFIFDSKKPTWPNPVDSIGEEIMSIGALRCWLPIGPALAAFEVLARDIQDLLEHHKDALKRGESRLRAISIKMLMIGSNAESASPTIVFISESPRQRALAKALLKTSKLLDRYPGVRIRTIDRMPAIYQAGSQEPDTVETTLNSTEEVSYKNNPIVPEPPRNIVSPYVQAEMETDSPAHFKNQLDLTGPVAHLRGQDEIQPASNPRGALADDSVQGQKRSYRQRRKDPSCDPCRERKVKCDATDNLSCTECSSRNVKCQFTKETNRRMASIKQAQDLQKELAQARSQVNYLRSILDSGIITPNLSASLDLPGSVRIEWQCHCGFASFDDFTSLQPGAIADYQTSLRDCIAIRNVAPSSQGRHSSGSGGGPFFGTISDLISTLLPKREGLIRYGNTQMAPINSSHAFQPSLPPVSATPRPLYLLLCVPCSKFATKLLQLDIKDLHSDRSFFKLLQDNYRDIRGRWRRNFSLKTIQGIKFVQFELHEPDLVDIQRYDDVPPESRKDEYHYSPIPPKMLPPVGENLMLHYYTSPCSARETGVVLNRIPKKLKERLQTCPINLTSEGWGIYFLEGWHVGIIAILGFAILLVASLSFLICWSVLKYDVQGAVGVATYIMAFIALGIGNLRAAFEL